MDCKPLHPYNIMLCKVSKYLTGDVEKMHSLGRTMGCRDTRGVECPTLLFLKLEEVGVLSQFSVTHLRNALEIMDLPEAAIRVKEYEEDYLNGQMSHIAPSTETDSGYPQSRPPSNDRPDAERSDMDTSMPPPYSFTQMDDEDPPSRSTVSSTVTESTTEETAMRGDEVKPELNSMDQEPCKMGGKKYHTVNPSTMRRDYPDVKFDFSEKRE